MAERQWPIRWKARKSRGGTRGDPPPLIPAPMPHVGYGENSTSPAAPVERFPRTDDGWGQAWRRYTQIENNFSEVGA